MLAIELSNDIGQAAIVGGVFDCLRPARRVLKEMCGHGVGWKWARHIAGQAPTQDVMRHVQPIFDISHPQITAPEIIID